MSPSSRAKLGLSRDLKMERSIEASIKALYGALTKAFSESVLNSMLDFLGSVIEREDEPREEDLAKFESLFRPDLAKAQSKDIVGVYKVLHLKVELKKCKDRIRDSLASLAV